MVAHGRLPGVLALAVFFAFGALMSFLAGTTLLFPGSPLEPMWRLNPTARAGLGSIGPAGIVLMLATSIACASAAIGLWASAGWGRRLAIGILSVNLLGNLLGAVLRHDPVTLIGLPIAVTLIAYLMSARVRHAFATPPDSAAPAPD